MPKLKDIALGIIVAPLLIPIMLIASYLDKKALKKEASGAASLSRMDDGIVHLGLLKPWNIGHLLIVKHEKSHKKALIKY
ncbi:MULTISPECIES: hypothetical protein [unclassified Acinetobacter]|uniref:hypothetical protein n=1 Tax=unclassified Acinetobacter TaxID=196816 RepID=UPI0029344CE7|nr:MULTISPECIES: hypothetical protein [unclassified Acinetobacter]WOE33404.1 hypothetical protein QSG84_16385 [Acinetobacter sp. SAAs470]WOE36878.1 hypothetical protein QSG86_00065 [Acinetobacter sp. SAAs474]